MADSSITSTCYKHHTRTGIPRLEILSKPRFTYSWSRTKKPAIEIGRADTRASEEVGRIQQHAPGLNVERPKLEPAARSEVDPRRNVNDGGDRQEKQEEFNRPVVAAQRQ